MAPGRSSSDQIHSIAEVLAASFSEEAVGRILAEHTADRGGRCQGCRYPTTPAPTWPCRLWEIATESERIRHAGPPSRQRSA